MFIDDTAGIHLMDIHAKLRRLEAEHGLGLVVVDYLQLMSGRVRFENRNQEISTISWGMKLLAKELNVPLVVLSQLNRAPETRQGDHRRSSATCARADRSSRMPTWWRSSFAKKSTGPTTRA